MGRLIAQLSFQSIEGHTAVFLHNYTYGFALSSKHEIMLQTRLTQSNKKTIWIKGNNTRIQILVFDYILKIAWAKWNIHAELITHRITHSVAKIKPLYIWLEIMSVICLNKSSHEMFYSNKYSIQVWLFSALFVGDNLQGLTFGENSEKTDSKEQKQIPFLFKV